MSPAIHSKSSPSSHHSLAVGFPLLSGLFHQKQCIALIIFITNLFAFFAELNKTFAVNILTAKKIKETQRTQSNHRQLKTVN